MCGSKKNSSTPLKESSRALTRTKSSIKVRCLRRSPWCHVSFYVFLFATVGSVFIGNYATHGWRRQTQVRYDDNERELLVQRTSVNKRLANSKEKRSKQGSDDTTRHVENAYIGLGFGANYDSAAEDSTTTDPMKYFLTGTGKGLEGIDALKLKWYDVWEWQLAIPFAS